MSNFSKFRTPGSGFWSNNLDNENLDSEISTPQQTDEEEVSFSTDVFNSCNIQSIHVDLGHVGDVLL